MKGHGEKFTRKKEQAVMALLTQDENSLPQALTSGLVCIESL